MARVAVVTGAAQGIGRAVALRLARAGHQVVVGDLNGDGAEETAAAAGELGVRAVAVVADVADEDAVAGLARAAADIGQLGTWVNNAGLIAPSMLHKMPASDFDRVMNVHARGTFLGIRAAARVMIDHQQGGVIINVTSSAGLGGTIGQINYAAAKGAINAMTKSAAKELGKHDIRVNAVSPAAATPMTETIRTNPKFAERYLGNIVLGRWAEADEVANTFAFLASEEATYITGQILPVDGGTYMVS
ncbi:MAG: SDR family NAD(P)-dependent oxidoreductase [Actinomycetota bacterium]